MPECAGDCDSHADCASGLLCFQRDRLEPVPGCRGDGKSGWDYCYNPEALDSTRGVDGSPNMPKCAGECDRDSDCAGELKCFQRNGFTAVPGCAGVGNKDWDYCYDKHGLDSSRGVDGSPNMPECAGECDKDSDCAGNLKCFQRDGFTAVPGCTGVGKKDWDYCYDPVHDLPPPLDSSRGVDGSPNMPRCAGECDYDSDCAGTLKCFQRNGFTPVPGCSGTGEKDWDYCYDPAMHHGSGVQIGSTILLWNPKFKHFMSNLAGRQISSSKGIHKDVTMDWINQRFTVVDATTGLIALHSQRFNCYLRMTSSSAISCSANMAATSTPPTESRFKAVPAKDGLFGLYSPTRGRYLSFTNSDKRFNAWKASASAVPADQSSVSMTFQLLQVPQHLELGSLVGFWRNKNLLRMTQDNMDSHGPLAEGRILNEWTWEQFEVVDAGDGQVALFCPAHNRFVKMTSGGTVQRGTEKSQSSAVTSEERFAVMPKAANTIALHNSAANRFLIINGPSQAPTGLSGSIQDAAAGSVSSSIWMKVVPIRDSKITSTMPGCCNCDHTMDRCRGMQVWMKSEPAGWIHRYWHRNWQVTADARGTSEVRWDCSRRRVGHERTGFNMPATHVDSYYDEGELNFHPKYCAPLSYTPRESPKDRGCCSIADGTVDRCRSRQYIEIQVGSERKRCYKGQTCEWEFPEPHPQGKTLHWFCGETQESVAWGLYFDTLQIKFNCDGEIEWNPWWCGVATGGEMPPEASTRLIDVFKVNSNGDLVDGKTGVSLTGSQVVTKAVGFARDNKDVICEGLSAAAVYDQLLRPSGTCWRAGMTGRSSLFPGHSDYGSKTSLFEEGTKFTREERPHSSNLLALADHVSKNASLLQLSGNLSLKEMQNFLPGLMTAYCAATGGTDCAGIGLEKCECYCVHPGRCTEVLAEKYAKSIAAIFEMAADIALAVMTGGGYAAAKAGAKAAAKAAMKAAAKKGMQGASRRIIKKAAVTAAKEAAKKAAIASLKTQGRKTMKKTAIQAIKSGIKDTAKEMVTDALLDALGLGNVCEDILESVLGEEAEDPDWVNDPEYKWGNEEGPAGYLETVDITGITALVGIFHEADCPTPVPGSLEGCPR
ncbi:unnamed protein product [Symbiodinium sp. CCMP2592]|nr:unnamed protein product [Symbiodinium sp. CCMP2592]